MSTNEIVKALRWIAKVRICETKIVDCNSCEFHGFCTDPDSDESISEQIVVFEKASDEIERLQKELDAADAKLDDLTDSGFCHSCTGCNAPHDPDKIRYCADWQWRGIESEGK